MHATAQQLRMTAQLYDTRDTVKGFLGAKYGEVMAEIGKVVSGLADKEGIPLLSAATRICKDQRLSGFTQLYVIAAAVELVEPS